MVSDNEILDLFDSEGLQWTNNPRDAVYLLPDGRMISAHSVWQPKNGKTRDIEHRIIFEMDSTIDFRKTEDGKVDWQSALETTEWIQLIPETKTILQATEATPQQERVLNQLKDFDIMEA